MQNDHSKNQAENKESVPSTPTVNEPGSINISGYVRVFDPNSQETLVEARE